MTKKYNIEKRHFDVIEFKKSVCEYYGITMKALMADSRKYPGAEARFVCFYLLAKYRYSEFEESDKFRLIGMHFNKDRNSIRYGIIQVYNWHQTDRCFREFLNEIEQKIALKIYNYVPSLDN